MQTRFLYLPQSRDTNFKNVMPGFQFRQHLLNSATYSMCRIQVQLDL
jgi:hypothetical protein